MKSLKIKLSLLALIAGMGGAFATMKHHSSDRKWTPDALGHYSEVTGQEGIDYSCSESSQVCTQTYPADIDPNDNPDQVQPTSTVLGDFQ